MSVVTPVICTRDQTEVFQHLLLLRQAGNVQIIMHANLCGQAQARGEEEALPSAESMRHPAKTH